MRVLHVRAAELESVDWDGLRGASAQVCIGGADASVLSVYVDWNWVTSRARSHEEARTHPRREPAVAV